MTISESTFPGCRDGSQETITAGGDELGRTGPFPSFDIGFRLFSQLLVLLRNGKKARSYVSIGLTLGEFTAAFRLPSKIFEAFAMHTALLRVSPNKLPNMRKGEEPGRQTPGWRC